MAELLVEYKDEAEKSAHPALKDNKLSTQSWLVLREYYFTHCEDMSL